MTSFRNTWIYYDKAKKIASKTKLDIPSSEPAFLHFRTMNEVFLPRTAKNQFLVKKEQGSISSPALALIPTDSMH